MTKVVRLEPSRHPIAATVTRYAQERHKTPRKEASLVQWSGVLCAAAAAVFGIGLLIKAGTKTYQEMTGAGLPPHVSAAIERKL